MTAAVACFGRPGFDASIAGTPWTGSEGVTETTEQLMSRAADYARKPRTPWHVPKKRPRGRTNFENLLLSPESPEFSTSGGDGPEPASLSTSTSFTGATLADTSAFPPDSMGAVGPAQYIVAVNGRIRSFNKATGIADGVLDLNPDVFFQSVMTPPVEQNFTSDPRIRYDRLSGRWFLIIIDVPGLAGALPNRIMLAVSDSAVITPSTAWTFFQFQHDLVAPTDSADTGKFADYPTLGIDANALYIGVNVFGTRGTGSFANTTAFVVRKSSILGAGPIVVTAFRKLISNSPQQSGPYTPQGVDNYDPSATEGYLIGVDAAFYGRLKMRRVTDPGGTPVMSANIQIDIPLNGNTINVPHLGNTNGTTGYLDGLDYRLIAAHVRNGKLWTTANVAVNNVGSPSGTDSRMGVRWYEIDTATETVVQSGTLFHPSGSNTADQRNYWMGSIMVSGQGHALMGFSVAGANEHANAGYAGRLATDAAGTLRTPVLYTASSSSYNPGSNPGGANGRRWGDYSYTSLDPNDDMTMWTIQQWCHANNTYAVQVVKVLAPPPALPVAATPPTVNAGQSNWLVTITGSVTDGSGFFDPGAGFSNRLAVAVNGGGVTINSVVFNNPTTLTVNLSVAPGAAAGARTITVTNPDGQALTSASGLLTIQATTSSNNPPALGFISDQTVTETLPLAFTATASDPDGHTLTFSLDPGAPAGAAINATNGSFTWTPSEAQGPATTPVTVRVTDNGVPPLSATQTFNIAVLETNAAPAIASVSGRTLHAEMTLMFTNSASDPDLPANTLTFSLDPGAPAGAAVHPSSGVFSWTPSDLNAGTTNPITIRVTDSGTPALDSAAAFSVVVVGRPLIQSIEVASNHVNVSWSAVSGNSYRLQYKGALTDPSWQNLPGIFTASGSTGFGQDPSVTSTQRFYRVQIEP